MRFNYYCLSCDHVGKLENAPTERRRNLGFPEEGSFQSSMCEQCGGYNLSIRVREVKDKIIIPQIPKIGIFLKIWHSIRGVYWVYWRYR